MSTCRKGFSIEEAIEIVTAGNFDDRGGSSFLN